MQFCFVLLEIWFDFIDGKSLKVHIPTKKWKISLEECTTWELLNMTIDDVCKLTDDLLTWVAEKNPSTTVDALRKKFDALLEVKTKRIKYTI